MAKIVESDELKSCPFCGGKASYTWKTYKGQLMRMDGGYGYWGTPEDSRTLYWVGCHNSNCLIKPRAYGDKDEAFDTWNKRKDDIK